MDLTPIIIEQGRKSSALCLFCLKRFSLLEAVLLKSTNIYGKH